MLSNLLVHIGYHKTGTTWLQKTLFSTKSKVFSPLSSTGNPKALGRHFVWDRDGNLLSPFETNKSFILEELANILAKKNFEGKMPVISNERLSGNPHSGGFDAKVIADRIEDSLPNAKILCVVREQKDMICSAYFQYLKAGGIDSIEKYLKRPYDGRRPGFSFDYLKYVNLVAYYHKLFTPKNVLVLPYELLKKNPKHFLEKIGSFVSVNYAEKSADWSVKYNKRLDNHIVSRFPFLNLISGRSSVNAYSPLYIPKSNKLIKATNLLLKGKSHDYVKKLKQQIKTLVDRRYIESNKKLSHLIGIDLSEYGYYARKRS